MGWVCDERPNAVTNTLRQVSKWWQCTRASGMQSDPHDHTRWKHTCGWHAGPVRRVAKVATMSPQSFLMDQVEFLTCLHTAWRRAAGGPSGMIVDHLFPLLGPEHDSGLFAQATSALARASAIPSEGWSPRAAMAPFYDALSTKAGCECATSCRHSPILLVGPQSCPSTGSAVSWPDLQIFSKGLWLQFLTASRDCRSCFSNSMSEKENSTGHGRAQDGRDRSDGTVGRTVSRSTSA